MVTLERVLTNKQRKEFADFPNELYRETPEYLPYLFSDTVDAMNPRKNFAFSFSEARFWLARRDEEIVGRIGAIINHKSDEKCGRHQMRFWNADFIDDPEISGALFGEVEKWAKETGCTEIIGPLGFTDLDLEGMLVDGFDETGIFCTYYNYPYYLKHLENLGFEKDVDWLEYKMKIPPRKDMEMLSKMSEFSQRVYKLHLKEIRSVNDIGRAAPEVVKLINITYNDLYSTTDLDIKQGTKYFNSFKIVLNPKTSALVYNDTGELVGFILSIPDISQAVKKSSGRLLPLGWLRILRSIRKNDEFIALLIGVHPDYQSKGVITILINKLVEGFWEVGAKTCRICPMLEENTKVLSLMNIIPTKPYKRRRSFIKRLK